MNPILHKVATKLFLSICSSTVIFTDISFSVTSALVQALKTSEIVIQN